MPPGFVLVLIPRALAHASLIFLFRTTRPTNQTGNPSTNLFAAKPLSCRHNIEISGVCTVHVSSSMTWLGFTNAGVDTIEALAHLHATDTPRQKNEHGEEAEAQSIKHAANIVQTTCYQVQPEKGSMPSYRPSNVRLRNDSLHWPTLVGTYGGVLIFLTRSVRC